MGGDEFAALLDAPCDELNARRVAERLRERMAHSGRRWVMLKGGHLPGAETTQL